MTDATTAIAERLAALGPHDANTWRGEITEEGEIVLRLPSQFGWEDNTLWLGDMEIADQYGLALMHFLGHAPHDLRALLDERAQTAAQLREALDALRADGQDRDKAFLLLFDVLDILMDDTNLDEGIVQVAALKRAFGVYIEMMPIRRKLQARERAAQNDAEAQP